MAWLLNLERLGLAPEIIVIEEVPPGGDWVEAEQFWIGYFRMIGADLCNHTIGGEGQTGYKQPPEMIAKRVMRGSANPNFGRPIRPQVKAALTLGNQKLRADPERWKRACNNRRAAFTDDMKASRIANLHRHMANPELRARAAKTRAEIARLPDKRKAVGQWSRDNWQTKRESIIAAQNAGKGEDWKRKHSALGRSRLQSPDHPLRKAAFARRKLTDDDVLIIRSRLANGENGTALAKEYGVSQTTISDVKTARYRK